MIQSNRSQSHRRAKDLRRSSRGRRAIRDTPQKTSWRQDVRCRNVVGRQKNQTSCNVSWVVQWSMLAAFSLIVEAMGGLTIGSAAILAEAAPVSMMTRTMMGSPLTAPTRVYITAGAFPRADAKVPRVRRLPCADTSFLSCFQCCCFPCGPANVLAGPERPMRCRRRAPRKCRSLLLVTHMLYGAAARSCLYKIVSQALRFSDFLTGTENRFLSLHSASLGQALSTSTTTPSLLDWTDHSP